MKAGIREYLRTSSAIVSAIGGSEKFYSFPAPQDAVVPYITISEVTDEIQNLIGSTLDIKNETWQIDIFAAEDAQAVRIKKLVIARLNIADRVEMGSYSVYSCSYSGGRDSADLETTGGETNVARKTLEFYIIRNNEVTTA